MEGSLVIAIVCMSVSGSVTPKVIFVGAESSWTFTVWLALMGTSSSAAMS